MHLQISMGGAQKWKRPPKHFYTGLAGEGCARIHRPRAYEGPQVYHRHGGAAVKGMDKAQTRARDWGFLKMAGAKLQLKFTLIRTTGLTPPSHRKFLGSGDLQLQTKISGFPFCGTCSQVPFRNWSRSLERWDRTEARAASSHVAVSTKVSLSLVIWSSVRLACISSAQSALTRY